MTIATIDRALLLQPPAVPPGAKKLRISDDKLPGFCLEISPTGLVTYRMRYSEAGRAVDVRLGRCPDLTPEAARQLATAHRNARIAEPSIAPAPQPAGPTLADFARDHFLPHAESTLISHREIETLLRLRILPALGHLQLHEVTHSHVSTFRKQLIAEGLSASRVNAHLAALRRAFNLANKWQLFDGRNPAASPGMLRTEGRETFLLEPQLRALIMALEADEDRLGADAIILLALTGARKSEILMARWEQIDRQRKALVVPRSKSGRRRLVYLSEEAIRVLDRQPLGTGREFVFPSARRAGQALAGLRGVWARAKAGAGLPADVRLHDLRHTFASLLVNDGVSLYEVGKLLGHTQQGTTARYAHLRDDRQLEAVNSVARKAGTTVPSRNPVAEVEVESVNECRQARLRQAIAAMAARRGAQRDKDVIERAPFAAAGGFGLPVDGGPSAPVIIMVPTGGD